jgi:hypothetical protein
MRLIQWDTNTRIQHPSTNLETAIGVPHNHTTRTPHGAKTRLRRIPYPKILCTPILAVFMWCPPPKLVTVHVLHASLSSSFHHPDVHIRHKQPPETIKGVVVAQKLDLGRVYHYLPGSEHTARVASPPATHFAKLSLCTPQSVWIRPTSCQVFWLSTPCYVMIQAIQELRVDPSICHDLCMCVHVVYA